jgi:glycosyltransferase involved in cell wall biosynthesis
MRQAIESVQRQTYTDIEHLIVIDGKEREEKARAILANTDTSRITTHIVCLPYPTGKNRFICHRIYGMATFLINGDYVCYLDEDNWYDPEHIEALVRITQEKGLDWAYSLRKIIDRDGNFLCLDDCESLGKWKYPLPNIIAYLVDTNCYFLKRNLALEFSHIFYGRFRELVSIGENRCTDNPDIRLCTLLLEQYPQVDTSGLYSVNYRLGGSEHSVKPNFFYHFNQIRQQEYPNGFPWRKTKLKDITLPRLLPKTADTTSYGEEFSMN